MGELGSLGLMGGSRRVEDFISVCFYTKFFEADEFVMDYIQFSVPWLIFDLDAGDFFFLVYSLEP